MRSQLLQVYGIPQQRQLSRSSRSLPLFFGFPPLISIPQFFLPLAVILPTATHLLTPHLKELQEKQAPLDFQMASPCQFQFSFKVQWGVEVSHSQVSPVGQLLQHHSVSNLR